MPYVRWPEPPPPEPQESMRDYSAWLPLRTAHRCAGISKNSLLYFWRTGRVRYVQTPAGRLYHPDDVAAIAAIPPERRRGRGPYQRPRVTAE